MALEATGKYRYPDPRPDWLARHVEAPLEPSLPIVDAHHHLWEEPGKFYLVPELLADARSGHAVVATVAVQAYYGYRHDGPEHLRPVGETERLEALRADARQEHPSFEPCAGIVAFANLLDTAHLPETLAAHRQASPQLRGIRQSVARDRNFPDGIVTRPAPAGLLADARFREGVRALGQAGLCFDAMLYHEQLPELAALADAAPNTRIVLDHVGTPIGVGLYRERRRETFEAWRAAILELARRPNVHVKLGGLGMIITGAEYHLADEPPDSARLAQDWCPWIETCIEAFGATRCMFESNFPVDKAMCSYVVLWNAFKRVTAGCSAPEKRDLFHDTAMRTYRLALTTSGHVDGAT